MYVHECMHSHRANCIPIVEFLRCFSYVAAFRHWSALICFSIFVPSQSLRSCACFADDASSRCISRAVSCHSFKRSCQCHSRGYTYEQSATTPSSMVHHTFHVSSWSPGCVQQLAISFRVQKSCIRRVQIDCEAMHVSRTSPFRLLNCLSCVFRALGCKLSIENTNTWKEFR